jgi:hypothetical protein
VCDFANVDRTSGTYARLLTVGKGLGTVRVFFNSMGHAEVDGIFAARAVLVIRIPVRARQTLCDQSFRFARNRTLNAKCKAPSFQNKTIVHHHSSYPSLHNLDSSIPSNKVQPFPLLHLPIALSALSHPQNTAHISRRTCTQLADTQHTSRAVCLLHRKSSRIAFDRSWRCICVWLCRGEEWTVGWCGEQGAVDCWVGAQSEDESREGG